MALDNCSQFFSPLSCAIVMSPTGICEIYIMTPLTGFDHVPTLTTGISMGMMQQRLQVCLYVSLPCTTVIHHERDVHLEAPGHMRMLKTHKGGKSVVMVISH